MSWEEAAADAADSKADTLEQAVVSLTRIAGIFKDTNHRRHEILSFTSTLEADAENFRKEAERLRGSTTRRGGGERMAEEGTQEQSWDNQELQEGEIIVAEFRVTKNMTGSEARELIRSSSPTSFQLQDVTLAENYSGGGGSQAH